MGFPYLITGSIDSDKVCIVFLWSFLLLQLCPAGKDRHKFHNRQQDGSQSLANWAYMRAVHLDSKFFCNSIQQNLYFYIFIYMYQEAKVSHNGRTTKSRDIDDAHMSLINVKQC